MKNLESLEFDARVLRRRIGVPDADGRCVVYWMQRSQRATDNAALNVAIEAGNLLDKPVVVYFQLLPRVRHATWRHYEFMRCGLTELPAAVRERGAAFVLRRYPEHSLLSFCSEVKPCLVIGDENPLREAEQSKARVAAELRVPFWTVDADVVVPSRLLGREHYAARTIRPKIRALLKQFLQPLANPAARAQPPARFFSQSFHGLENFPIDGSIAPVSGIAGGGAAAHRTLAKFLRERLAGYASQRNKPDIEGTSRLSPYLHFGQISPHTVALAVKNSDAPAIDREAFLEELIVRRELAVNFVRYNSRYDAADAGEPWAERTLRAHARDQRKFLYREAQLESAETHDPLWNAAQKQMVLTGWMHGYMRMYWAKKKSSN